MTDTTDHTNDTLWVTDAELIRRSGVPDKIARAAIRALDASPNSGFPKKDKLWGDRRYWPAVEAYWRAVNQRHAQNQLDQRSVCQQVGETRQGAVT